MSSSFLAIVLLENPVTPDMSAIAKALRSRHPGLPVEMEMSGDPRGSPLIHCGGELVAVMSMPAPMPDDPGLWDRTASTWPEGKMIAARSRGHVIVSVLGKDRPPVATARLNTAVIGALISAVPGCSGVVWGGKVARPAKLWLDMSRRSFAPFPDYPFTLWVDILPFRSERGIGAVTMGLAAFTEREVEFETTKLPLSELIDKVTGLSAYLVEHGNVIKDGDTFGGDERERFAASHRNSERFGGMPVLFCATD